MGDIKKTLRRRVFTMDVTTVVVCVTKSLGCGTFLPFPCVKYSRLTVHNEPLTCIVREDPQTLLRARKIIILNTHLPEDYDAYSRNPKWWDGGSL